MSTYFNKSNNNYYYTKCEVDKYFIRFKFDIQGYVQNEIALNDESTCRNSCSDYTKTKIRDCNGNNFCTETKTCKGIIRDCQPFDGEVNVCISVKVL